MTLPTYMEVQVANINMRQTLHKLFGSPIVDKQKLVEFLNANAKLIVRNHEGEIWTHTCEFNIKALEEAFLYSSGTLQYTKEQLEKQEEFCEALLDELGYSAEPKQPVDVGFILANKTAKIPVGAYGGGGGPSGLLYSGDGIGGQITTSSTYSNNSQSRGPVVPVTVEHLSRDFYFLNDAERKEHEIEIRRHLLEDLFNYIKQNCNKIIKFETIENNLQATTRYRATMRIEEI